MLTEKDAVIFDLDGTIIDSMWIWPEVDDEYLAKYQLTMPTGFFEAMEGMSYTETAEYFLRTFPKLNQTVAEIKQEWTDMVYDKYRYEVPLKPGVFEFIHNLKARGIKCGIATSNSRELAEEALRAHGLLDLFETVRISCEVAAGKPAPDVYLKAAADLGVAPNRCLVFEDVPQGIMAGINAGMTVCAVDDECSRGQDEKKRALAHYYIYNYDDIKNNSYEVLS